MNNPHIVVGRGQSSVIHQNYLERIGRKEGKEEEKKEGGGKSGKQSLTLR